MSGRFSRAQIALRVNVRGGKFFLKIRRHHAVVTGQHRFDAQLAHPRDDLSAELKPRATSCGDSPDAASARLSMSSRSSAVTNVVEMAWLICPRNSFSRRRDCDELVGKGRLIGTGNQFDQFFHPRPRLPRAGFQ